MILLVVDTQKGCFDERLYAFETVRNNIKQLITIARENHVEVVYVQHDDGPGTEFDKTADNYEIWIALSVHGERCRGYYERSMLR